MQDNEIIDQPIIVVPRIVLMSVECLDLILNTRQIVVFKGRFQAFSEHLNYLKNHENDNKYLGLCEIGFNNFKSTYPKKIFIDHFYSLRQPSKLILMLPSLYIECLFRTAIDYGKHEVKVINNLKKASTRYKKIIPLIEFFNEVMQELVQLNQEKSVHYQQLEENLQIFETAKEQIIKSIKS